MSGPLFCYMRNSEIIANELEKTDLDYLVPMRNITTKAEWLRCGYKIKAGESARFKAKIWKPINKKILLVTPSFYDITQVEIIKEGR